MAVAYSFSEEAARRVVDAVKRVEAAYGNTRAYRATGPRSGGGPGSVAALVTITSATVTASKQPGTVVKGGSGTCKVQNYYSGQSALTNGKTYYAVLDGEDGGEPLYWVALEDCP